MEESRRFYSLDLLKFVLSILIVFHHFQQDIVVHFRYINFFDGVFNFAYCVELFFIISGFLAAMKKKKTSSISLKDYLFQKVRRFFPMSALSVAMMILLELAYFLINGAWYHGLKPDIYKVFNSLMMTFSGGSVLCGRGINNPLWFVSVLLKCYIIFWIILKLSEKHGFSIVYPSIAMISIGTAVNSYQIDLPFLNEEASRGYAAFFLGILLYELYCNVNHKRVSVFSFLILFLCFGLGILDYSTFYHYEWGTYTFIVLPCVLFATLLFERNCQSEVCIVLGKLSFEIYVWHASFIYLLEIIRSLYPDIMDMTDHFVLMMVFTLIVMVFAFLMYRFVEKEADRRFLDLIRYFKAEKGNEK